MTRFLGWLRSIMAAVLNGVAKFIFLIILIFVVLLVYGLARGDGLPGNMVLTLDLRQSVPDSAATGFSLSGPQQTMMNYVFALDAASRDPRVKGVVMRLGNGAISLAQAEELSASLHRFRDQGKFVIAQATGFLTPGAGRLCSRQRRQRDLGPAQKRFQSVGRRRGRDFPQRPVRQDPGRAADGQARRI